MMVETPTASVQHDLYLFLRNRLKRSPHSIRMFTKVSTSRTTESIYLTHSYKWKLTKIRLSDHSRTYVNHNVHDINYTTYDDLEKLWENIESILSQSVQMVRGSYGWRKRKR